MWQNVYEMKVLFWALQVTHTDSVLSEILSKGRRCRWGAVRPQRFALREVRMLFGCRVTRRGQVSPCTFRVPHRLPIRAVIKNVAVFRRDLNQVQEKGLIR